LWKQYPNKKSKPKAFTAYKKAIKEGTTDDEILKGIENYKREIELKRTDKQYIAHASTWFNQKRWLDEYDLVSGGTEWNRNAPVDEELGFYKGEYMKSILHNVYKSDEICQKCGSNLHYRKERPDIKECLNCGKQRLEAKNKEIEYRGGELAEKYGT